MRLELDALHSVAYRQMIFCSVSPLLRLCVQVTSGLREYLTLCQSSEDGFTFLESPGPSCVSSLPTHIPKPMDGQSYYSKGYETFLSSSGEDHPWEEFYKTRTKNESKQEEISAMDGDVNHRLQQALLALEKETGRADREKERADREKERADQADLRTDREEDRADREKERADALERKFRDAQK